jgi:hypothetical protein
MMMKLYYGNSEPSVKNRQPYMKVRVSISGLIKCFTSKVPTVLLGPSLLVRAQSGSDVET